MKIRKAIGYTLLASFVGGYLYILSDSPWWLFPLSMLAAIVFVAVLGLIAWLIVGNE
jgi:hypothetical protein